MDLKQRLNQGYRRSGSRLCVGIDPHPREVRRLADLEGVGGSDAYLTQWFGEKLIDVSQAQQVHAVKFQMAFFEALGSVGYGILEGLVKQAKSSGFFVILDGKRGDISSTMAAYGTMAYEHFGVDSLTINPYMGDDVWLALKPWLSQKSPTCSVFVVWRTSNPSAGLIQDHPDSENALAKMLLAKLVNSFTELDMLPALGVVVGAGQIASLCHGELSTLEQLPALVPGVGAQGASIHAHHGFQNQPWHLWPIAPRPLPLGHHGGEQDEKITLTQLF